MRKPCLFYFVHAHGKGHRATFHMLYPALSQFFEVVAITTNSEITHYLRQRYAVQVLALPLKYPADYSIPAHTFSKAFEVTPYAIEPAKRARALSEWIERYEPKAFYCDGVPELAIAVRSMGVPVVLVHLPGNIINDPTQIFAHQLADHIIAHFPSYLEQAEYSFIYKTFYSGYMSRYAQAEKIVSTNYDTNKDATTILLGYDNYDASILRRITKNQRVRFTIIGNKQHFDLGNNCTLLGPVEDIEHSISSDVVISAAGQNTVAELLSLKKKIILLPEQRPYDEQKIHAKALADNKLALLAHENLSADEWQQLLRDAKSFVPNSKCTVDHLTPYVIAQNLHNWYG